MVAAEGFGAVQVAVGACVDRVGGVAGLLLGQARADGDA